ncbi:hypothetical protein GPN2_20966 [Streptomyces murinus]
MDVTRRKRPARRQADGRPRPEWVRLVGFGAARLDCGVFACYQRGLQGGGRSGVKRALLGLSDGKLHPGEVFGDGPQPLLDGCLVRLRAGGDQPGVAHDLVASAGTVVLAAERGGVGGGAQGRQRAHRRLLGDQRREPGERKPEGRGGIAGELGAGHAGVRGHRDGRAVRGEPALQLVREHQVGQLGLTIGADPAVRPLPLQVVEVDRGPDTVAGAADRHHARAGHRQHQVQQQPGEREVAEVVGAELQLEAVPGGLLRGVHHAGVVDQQVEAVEAGPQRRRRGPDGVERGQVQRLHGHVAGHAGRSLLALLDVAHGEHHGSPALGERLGGLVPQSGVGPGHHGHSPALVRNIRRRPLFTHVGLPSNYVPKVSCVGDAKVLPVHCQRTGGT